MSIGRRALDGLSFAEFVVVESKFFSIHNVPVKSLHRMGEKHPHNVSQNMTTFLVCCLLNRFFPGWRRRLVGNTLKFRIIFFLAPLNSMGVKYSILSVCKLQFLIIISAILHMFFLLLRESQTWLLQTMPMLLLVWIKFVIF